MSDPVPSPESPAPTPEPKPPRPPKRRSSSGRRPLTQAQSRSLGTWIFGGLFVLFLIGVFTFAPPALPVFKQRILAIVSALLAGLFTYFFTGDLGVSLQGGKGSLGKLAVKGTGGVGAFVLVLAWWLSPWSPVESADLIRLRILVLDPQGVPVEDAKVWATVGGETKKVAGGWEIDIPFSNRPADGKVTVYATKETAFLQGSQEVVLGSELKPSVTLRLEPDRSQSVGGIVQDAEGKALEGVRVSIVGHEVEAVTTGPTGQFVLPAHAAKDQQVLLRVEKDGYEAIMQHHPAGHSDATLVLEQL